jgi:HD-like signal output (HDOD) protein
MKQNNTESILADFQQRFHGKIRIAALKMNIHRLLSALADDEMEPKQLAAILQHYPVISSRLVGLANSPWVRPVTPITNIETACIRLGRTQVKTVSIATAVGSSFNTVFCPSFNPVRFWATSMLVGEGACLLASKLPGNASYSTDMWQTLKTGGILHNIGLLWLADMFSAETEQALKLTAADPSLTVNQALIEAIGIDYCTVGAWVGKQWHLPEELVAIIERHRNISVHENHTVHELLVGAAARMVSSLFHGRDVTADLNLNAIGLEAEQQQSIFEQLSNKLEPTKELARQILK